MSEKDKLAWRADRKIIDDWQEVLGELAFGPATRRSERLVAIAALNRSFDIRKRVMSGEDDE